MLPEFKNQGYMDFSVPENRKRMEEELAKAEASFGKEYDLYIGGSWVFSEEGYQ